MTNSSKALKDLQDKSEKEQEAYYLGIYNKLIKQDIKDNTSCFGCKCCQCWKTLVTNFTFQTSWCQCTRKCKLSMSTIRQNQMRERLEKMRVLYPSKEQLKSGEIEMFTSEPSQGSLLWTAFKGLLPANDFLSDFLTLKMIYDTFQKERTETDSFTMEVHSENGSTISPDEIKNHYFYALVISLVSTSTSIMFMLSCMIVIKFSQSDFENAKWKTYSKCSKFFHLTLLSVFGFFTMLFVFFMDIIQKWFLFGASCLGHEKYLKTEQFFSANRKYISGLTLYQLQQLDKSTLISQALFEDIPQALLMLSIRFEFLEINGLTSRDEVYNVIGFKIYKITVLEITLCLSILNIIYIITTIYFESRSLCIPKMVYLQTRMTANNKWFPLAHKFDSHKLNENLSFSDFKIETSLTRAFGHVYWIEFQFIDLTLDHLLDKLVHWNDKEKGKLKREPKKKKLIFNEKCLERVTLNMIIHFIANFPHELFDLELKFDLEALFEKKIEAGMVTFTESEYKQIKAQFSRQTYQYKTIKTVTGHSALNLCMLDEKSKSEKWLLKPIFQKMITEAYYDQYDQGPLHPLSQAIENDCIESIKVMTSGMDQGNDEVSSFVPISFDRLTKQCIGPSKKGEESFLGTLLKKIASMGRKHQHLEFYVNLLDNVTDKIDFNKRLILHEKSGTTLTLIQYLAKRLSKSGECDFFTGEDMLMNKVIAKKQKATEETEIETLVNQTSRFIARYDGTFSSHKRCMGALSTLCKQSQINIVKYYKYKNGEQSYPLVEYLMKDWKYSSAQDFDSLMKKYFNNQGNPLKQLVETINESKEAKQNLFKFKSKALIFKILDFGIIKFDDQLFKSAIDYAQRELVADDYEDLHKRIKTTQSFQSFRNQIGMDQFNDANRRRSVYVPRSRKISSNDSKNLVQRLMPDDNIPRSWVRFVNETNQKHEIAQLKEIRDENYTLNLKKKNHGHLIKEVVMLLTELIGSIDLVTDIIILLDLLSSQHIAWTSLTIFSMVAPFYICHIPYLSFLTQKYNKELSKLTCSQWIKRKIMGFIMVTPLMTLFLFFMDLSFLIFTVILQTVMLLTTSKTCQDRLEQVLDKLYLTLFEMQKLDVSGFRRMRTISQLTFESTIQILLQIRIFLFLYFKDVPFIGKNALGFRESNFDVELKTIVVSIVVATLHFCIELFFIYLESEVTKTTFLNYVIVCFNGRYGWIPYQEYLTIYSKKIMDDLKATHAVDNQDEKDVNQNQEKIELNFGDISQKFVLWKKFDWTLTQTLNFTFTNDSISTFANVLATFPEKDKDLPVIKFGNTIDQISLENLKSLLNLSANRVQIDLEGVNLPQIFGASKYKKLLTLDDPNKGNEEEKNFFNELLKRKNYQLLKFLLEENPNLMKTLYKEPRVDDENRKNEAKDIENGQRDEKQMNLAELVYKTKDAKLLEVLLQQNNEDFNSQLGILDVTRKTMTFKLLMLQEYDIWEAFANYSDILTGSLLQELLKTYDHLITERYDKFYASQKFWQVRLGNSCPREWSCKLGVKFIKTFKSMYPEHVHFSYGKGTQEKYINLKIKTKHAFQFAALRRILAEAWNINNNGPQQDCTNSGLEEEEAIELSKYFKKINNLKNIESPKKFLENLNLIIMIMSEEQHNDVGNLTKDQVKELDEVAKTLMLDTDTWLYNARTRLNDQTGHTIRCTFYGKDVTEIQEAHRVHAGYPQELSGDLFINFKRYSSTLKVQMSKQAQAVIGLNYNFEPTRIAQAPLGEPKGTQKTIQQIQLGCFIQNPNHSYFAQELLQNNTPEQGAQLELDSQKWALVDVDQRQLDSQLSPFQARTISAMQSIKGGTEIDFTTYIGPAFVPQIRCLKVQMDIAFKIDNDTYMEEELEKLNQLCTQLYNDWQRDKLETPQHSPQPSPQPSPKEWKCDDCGQVNQYNPNRPRYCDACDEDKDDQSPPLSVPEPWECPECGMHNQYNADRPKYCVNCQIDVDI